MVITRGITGFVDLQKAKSLEWFQKFGRSDITWISRDVVMGNDGRVKNVKTTDCIIIGDLQFDVKLISQYTQMGIAKSGDGIIYTVPEHAIVANDEIVVDGINWRIVSQVEAEQTNGVTIYQGWVCRRTIE